MVVSTALGSPPASPSESPNKLVILPLCLSKNPPAWVSHDKHELKESNITENNFEIHHCVVTCCKRLPAPLLGSGSDSGSGWPASPCCGRHTACQEEYVVLFTCIFWGFFTCWIHRTIAKARKSFWDIFHKSENFMLKDILMILKIWVLDTTLMAKVLANRLEKIFQSFLLQHVELSEISIHSRIL